MKLTRLIKEMFIEGITYHSLTHKLPVLPKILSFSSPSFLQDVRKRNGPLHSYETDLMLEALQEMQKETSFHTLHYVMVQIDDCDVICLVNEDMKQAQTCHISLRSHTTPQAKKSFLTRAQEVIDRIPSETLISVAVSVSVVTGAVLFMNK